MSALAAPVRIIVDLYEGRSRVPELLRAQHVAVRVERLAVGDYDVGGGVLVERKTAFDLLRSLERARLWRQVGNLRQASRFPYLIIEGASLDVGSVGPEATRGACLAVIGQGVPIIRTIDPADSALWLRLLAQRAASRRVGRDRPVYAQRLKPGRELVREAMLAAVPGVSVATARALLARFGSVSAIVAAEEQALLEVPGVGPRRASALRDALS